MKDIPETVQWLLGFANLGCKEGKLNPQRFRGHTLPIVKRPPTEPPTKKDRRYPNRDKPNNYFVDKAGYLWEGDKTTENPKFHGEAAFYPTLEEFEDFFSKNRIIPIELSPTTFPIKSVLTGLEDNLSEAKRAVLSDYKLNVHQVLINLFQGVRYVLGFIIQENDKKGVVDHYKKMFEKIKPLATSQSNNTQLKAVYTIIFAFWDYHRMDLHPRLRQCPGCGAYWIADNVKKQGRPQEYCTKVCENEFNQASRRKNSESSQRCKKRKRKKSRRDKETELINHFKNCGETLETAKYLAKEAVRDGQSIEDFRPK